MILAQNEGQVSAVQQVMMGFFEEFSRQNPSVINLDWKEEKEEDNEKEDQQKDEQKEASYSWNGWDKDKNGVTSQRVISPQLPSIKLFQDGQKIADGVLENGQVYVFPPGDEAAATRLAGQIEIIQSLPPGTVIPNAPNLRVEIETPKGDKETVLATNSQGEITTNIKTQTPQISGTEVIQKHLNQSESNPAVQSTINQLLKVLDTQRQFQERTLKQLAQQNQQLAQQNQQLIQLLQERQKQPRNPNWWQKISQISPIKKWINQRQEKQLATTLRDLFVKRSANGENYKTPIYTLASLHDEDNNQHILSLKDNKTEDLLIEFSVDKDTGEIQVIKNQLSTETAKEIQQVKQALKNTTKFPPNFLTPIEYEASQKQQKQEKVVNEILRRVNGQAQRVEGQRYILDISSQGDLTITAQDGRGVILHHSSLNQGNINQMTNYDLNFFETQLAAQKPTQSTSDKTKTIVTGGRKR